MAHSAGHYGPNLPSGLSQRALDRYLEGPDEAPRVECCVCGELAGEDVDVGDLDAWLCAECRAEDEVG